MTPRVSSPIHRVAVKRQGTFKRATTMWVVAFDGSRLSVRALRLAASIKAQHDTIAVIAVTDDSAEKSSFGKTVETELRNNCKLQPTAFAFAPISKVAGDANPIRAAILKYVESKQVHNPILVMGSAGRGQEDAGKGALRAKGQAPMSKLAEMVRAAARHVLSPRATR